MHTLKIALFLLILISTSSKAITEINYMVIQDQAQPFQNHQNKKHWKGKKTALTGEIPILASGEVIADEKRAGE